MSMSGGWQQEDNSWTVQQPIQKAERGEDSPHHKVPSQTLRNHPPQHERRVVWSYDWSCVVEYHSLPPKVGILGAGVGVGTVAATWGAGAAATGASP